MKDFFKTFKEELTVIPLLIIGFFALNMGLSYLFPNNAFFDFFSEMENIAYSVVRFIVVLALAWVGVRVIFPNVFKFLKNEFYPNFPKLETQFKYKLATAIFLVFVLASAITAKAQDNTRHELLKNLTEQLDVREVTANSSPMIDTYLQSVGFDYPVPWCAAFVSWNLNQLDVDNPNSAWSPSFARDKDVIWRNKTRGIQPKCSDVVTFYYARLKRVGHVGFFIKESKSGYFITIEGNTNGGGSREGDGVYMKKRPPGKVFAISRYIKEV
ncbi:CHAP domain-containing protein [Carboxylicivirga marina]|uniref:CHAP domain-containing protein n=1 Tax=Carboxylicivirga marina TaxID=2800988 RepID=A0ABS1HGD7_9BACT|nr:CHAP domain-containing protein [Carboxylicivirga marina]MBK3516717.1 CHAP domain-containing protein [Carboxylicivirga marina]